MSTKNRKYIKIILKDCIKIINSIKNQKILKNSKREKMNKKCGIMSLAESCVYAQGSIMFAQCANQAAKVGLPP